MKKLRKIDLLIIGISLFFSWILFWRTFETGEGTIQMASKTWSDFGATLPLIRSFTYGDNFPPQYPIFAGPPIRYHFVFFMIVGLLEKAGVPLDLALNTLSTLSFTTLLFLIFYLSKCIFKSTSVGILSVVLFLFNGSFGFIEFFKTHTLNSSIFQTIITNERFTSFGPYDGKVVSAFWSLNIFTNQRHLALGYALTLLLLYLLYRFHTNKARFTYPKAMLLGIGIGLMPFIHLTGFTMMAIILLSTLTFMGGVRKQILVTGIIAAAIGLPQIVLMGQSEITGVKLINPGYLIAWEFTFTKFLSYWFFNLGIISLLAPIGLFLSDKSTRKVFIPFLLFFVVGNTFQLSPEMASNHKFFNMFVIGANMFGAYALVWFWKRHTLAKLIVPIFLIPLTLTGIIDLFPIVNDHKITINDIPKNETAMFILKNTPADSVILNSQFLFDPASLAGRKIYLGWPYFSWSAGYDSTKRHQRMKEILASTSIQEFCALTYQETIDYVEILTPTPLEDTIINYDFFGTLPSVFYNAKDNLTLYDVKANCL